MFGANPADDAPADELLTTADICRDYRMTPPALQRVLRLGRVEGAFKVGENSWRVPRVAWLAYLRGLNGRDVEAPVEAERRRRRQRDAEARLDELLGPPGGKRSKARKGPPEPRRSRRRARRRRRGPRRRPRRRPLWAGRSWTRVAAGALFPEQVAAHVGAGFDAAFRATLHGLTASGLVGRKGGAHPGDPANVTRRGPGVRPAARTGASPRAWPRDSAAFAAAGI